MSVIRRRSAYCEAEGQTIIIAIFGTENGANLPGRKRPKSLKRTVGGPVVEKEDFERTALVARGKIKRANCSGCVSDGFPGEF